jgi:hypothetical protein
MFWNWLGDFRTLSRNNLYMARLPFTGLCYSNSLFPLRMKMAMQAALRRATKAFAYALLGALVFWTPNIVVHWIIAYRFSGYVVMGLTLLLPAITIVVFRVLSWSSPKRQSRLSQALFAVLGIWIAGPAMLTFSSSFCGGGLTQPDAWRFFVFGTLLFPVFTLVMSAYDGTFFALLLTTVLLPVLVNSRLSRTGFSLSALRLRKKTG